MVTPIICANENDLRMLKGDFSELVKVTFNSDNPKCFDFLNGNYYFVWGESIDLPNLFIRQSPVPPVIDRLYCRTEHLKFDQGKGIVLSPLLYSYLPVGFDESEYDGLKSKLESIKAWRPLRQMTVWEFACSEV